MCFYFKLNKLIFVSDICHTQYLCKNNGGCLISTEEPFYKCRCDIGFTGDHCELKSMILSYTLKT